MSASPRPLVPEREQPIDVLLRPFHRFFSTAVAGGIVLLATSLVAFAWANSPWAAGYEHFWELPLGIGTPDAGLSLPIHAWINDGLMAVFFFLVGLEIKRETLVGELATRRSATLPIAAALGGMVVPAGLYALVNAHGAGAHGWGIPMATDIAFALGILALLGDRVPSSLRIFLAAFAIADDLGAVLVIALFYTSAIDWMALAGAGGLLALLLLLNRLGARRPLPYALLGFALWLCMLKSGIHATIAGVLLAFTIPARTLISEDEFIRHASESLAAFRAADAPGVTVLSSGAHQDALHAMERATDAAQAPLQRMEHALHGVVQFLIMPLFALANAGVTVTDIGAALRQPVVIGIALGLVVGKPIGITFATLLAVRSGHADLPTGASWRHVVGIAFLGGMGFTMSLFIAGLAFETGALLPAAKFGILGASLVAGGVGYTMLRAGAGAGRGLDGE